MVLTGFTSSTDSNQLTNFKSLVKNYIKNLELIRTDFKKTMGNTSSNCSVMDIRDTANALKKDYFHVLSKYKDIKTLFLRHPFSVIKSTMRQHYYQYGGSNCSLVDNPQRYGPEFSLAVFNKTCQKDLKKLINPEPMPITQFKSGLPEGFEYNETSVPLTFISVFPGAVVQPNGDVHYRSLHVIPHRCKQHTSIQTINGECYKEVFTVAQYWGGGFYHATVEDIPRIAPYVQFLLKYPSIYIHVFAKNSYTKTFTAKLGIPSSRLITGIIQARVLYLPAGGPCGIGSFFSTQMLSAYLRSTLEKTALPSAVKSQHQKSVILQKRSSKRWFKNYDAIVKALKPEVESHGLKLEIFSDKHLPSLNETVAMFDRAVLVVAPHGAGESNMLFA